MNIRNLMKLVLICMYLPLLGSYTFPNLKNQAISIRFKKPVLLPAKINSMTLLDEQGETKKFRVIEQEEIKITDNISIWPKDSTSRPNFEYYVPHYHAVKFEVTDILENNYTCLL